MNRKLKSIILLAIDILLIFLTSWLTIYMLTPFIDISNNYYWILPAFFAFMYMIFGSLFRTFSRINRFTNLNALISIFLATTLSYLVNFVCYSIWFNEFSKRLVTFEYIMVTLAIILIRLFWRFLMERTGNNKDFSKTKLRKRTLIIGAGEGGKLLFNTLTHSKVNNEIKVVGFIDDDLGKTGAYISNKKIFGTIETIPKYIEKYDIEMVIIAIPSLSNSRLKEIVDLIEPFKVKVTTMPSMEELASGIVSVSKLKNIDVVDLLGRDEVELDIESIRDQITNKTILVTGAGGSIGSEICRQVMKFEPKKLLLLGHGENSIYLIDRELKHKYPKYMNNIVPIIADVQDRNKIFDIMGKYNPDIVYHAAAHKHVPLMEYNPRESVKNNIYGSKNVAEAAKAANVKNFVMVSTDKANNPPNVMGATKRLAEMIVTGLNEGVGTKFSAVRFGNVLGSRGSVIPVFREQIENGGPITVTDKRMTRYFMTIPEASRLVIQSGALAAGGEIFVLDMGEPVKIVDLAKNMIRLSGYTENEIKIVESGIRPGEKLYEELLLDKERNDQAVFEKIFVGNIKGFSYDEVMRFLSNLSDNDEVLAKEVVKFANLSNQ